MSLSKEPLEIELVWTVMLLPRQREHCVSGMELVWGRDWDNQYADYWYDWWVDEPDDEPTADEEEPLSTRPMVGGYQIGEVVPEQGLFMIRAYLKFDTPTIPAWNIIWWLWNQFGIETDNS